VIEAVPELRLVFGFRRYRDLSGLGYLQGGVPSDNASDVAGFFTVRTKRHVGPHKRERVAISHKAVRAAELKRLNW
jgi:hypothetical protein